MEKLKRILFLCTGNSCRSQMAEGWSRNLADTNRYEIQSAGIVSHGMNPRAIAVMWEAGVDISEQQSTIVSGVMLHSTHMLVTVCGHADEHCPLLPTGINKIHWPLNDPAKALGTNDEIMQIFRQSRDEIKQRVIKLFEDIES